MPRSEKKFNISVIVPIYNQEKFLTETIESVLAQTFRDFELLLIDDASQDSSPHIGQSFAQKQEAIVWIQHSKNRGPGAARNTGIKAARGSFCAFLDGDDLMDPQCLERQIQLFQTDTNIDIVYTALKVIDETGQLLTQIRGREEKSEDFFPLMLFRNQIPGPGTIMAKKNVFCGLGYPEDRKHGEDYALMLRLAEAKYRFFYLDEPLYMYRRHSNNLSNQLNIQQQSAAQIVCQYPLATLEAAVAASSFSSEEKTLLLAKILWNQNRIETAVEKFSSLTSQEAYFYLGNYWLQKHDPQRASLFFDQGLLDHLSPNPAIFNNQGVALSRLGRIEEAQEFFVKALAISPSYLDAQHNLRMLRIHPDQLAITSRFLRISPLPYI